MDIDRKIIEKFRIKRRDVLPFRGRRQSSRATIYELFAELGYTYGAEVGVRTGSNAKEMLTAIPNLKLLLVDPWSAFSKWSDARGEKNYQRCLRDLKNRNVEYIRKTSIEAVKDVEDLSLDFVYIDAMHDFDNVMTDIILWSSKVKIGGIVSGHDYANSYRMGVIEAVKAYTYIHNIHDYYITGRVQMDPEYPSFFWVKK